MAQGVKGEVEYDVYVRVRTSKELKDKANKKAERNNTNLSDVIRKFLNEYVEENAK